ncbi:MAG: diacylglycerol kinase family protein [Firmicutes bacterium]|nr:diacylglycerol kinase family protein [Bacillota bacterium]
MRVHCLLAAAALILAWVVGFTPLEWAVLVLTITQVLTAELFNTAVEITVNLITKEYHPLAKAAKNVAAGAVLISSCGALVVGGALFLTRIFSPR